MKVELSKDVPEDAFVFTAIASKEVEDDEGEIISLKGMDFSRFKKNPTIKRDHSINADDSVGSAIELEVRGDELWVKAFISSTESKLIKKVKEGVIRDLSIGFLPVEVEGNMITKSILYEVTLTGLGCNDGAKIVEKNKSSKLSLKTFTIKTMDEKKKETTAKVVEKNETFSKEEVSAIAEKSAEVAVKKALETSKKIEKESKIEKDKKEFKQERAEKSNSMMSVGDKGLNNLDAKEVKKKFFTTMFKHRGEMLGGRGVSEQTLLSLKKMTSGVDTAGGYAIHEQYNKELLTDVMNEAVMLPLVKQYKTSGNNFRVPIMENATPAPTQTDEGADKPESDGVMREVVVNIYKIASKTYFDDELLEDADYDLIEAVIEILNQNAALEIDTQILQGTGDAGKEMEGIMTNVSIPTVDMIDETDFDKILQGVDTLPVRYRKVKRQKSLDSRGDMLAFIIGTSSKTFLRTLKASDGRYYWSEPVAGAEYPTLDGFPVIEVDDSFLPANEMLFGNFKKGYAAIIRNSGRIDQSMHYRFANDQQTLRFFARMGGKVVDANAFVIFENVGQTTP